MTRASDAITRIHELRCMWGFQGDRLVMYVDLVTSDRSGPGKPWTRRRRVLCHGTSVWPPRLAAGARTFGDQAVDWLEVGSPAAWPERPGMLPDPTVAQQWGDFVAARLERGVGAAVLAWLLEEQADRRHADVHVRLVFHALDASTERIPVETIQWPRFTDKGAIVSADAVSVSVLRVAGPLDDDAAVIPPRLGARQPGYYVPVVLNAPADGHDEGLGELQKKVRHGSIQGIGVAAPRVIARFKEFDLTTRDEVARADLVVVAGHGTAEGLVIGESMLTAPQLASGLRSGPSVVVLAMCGSAVSPSGADGSADPSVAESLARAGLGLSVGFQGDETWGVHAEGFVERLTAEVRAPLDGVPHRCADLLDWDLALARARGSGPDAVAAVVYVHPALLDENEAREFDEKEALEVDEGETREHSFRVQRRVRTAKAIAEPWYVPGQVVCFPAPGHPELSVRLPLPVAAGATLTVELLADGEHRSVGSVVDRDLLAVLAAAWELHRRHAIVITLDPGDHPAPLHWARRSAELSATIRALKVITGERPPPAVFETLNRGVAADWGAPDAAARLIDVVTGEPFGRLGSWPELAVGRTLSAAGGSQVPPPGGTGPVVSDAWSLLSTGLSADVVLTLLRHQLTAATARPDELPEGLRPAAEIVQDGVAAAVLIPTVTRIHRAGEATNLAWRVATLADGVAAEIY